MSHENIARHHREKPTNHPLRTWRKLHRPTISLAVLAESLECTRAHLSLIEHYKVVPGFWLAVRLNMITGIPPDWMVKKQDIDSERRRIRKQFDLALKDHYPGKARR